LNFQVLEHNKHRACNFDIFDGMYNLLATLISHLLMVYVFILLQESPDKKEKL